MQQEPRCLQRFESSLVVISGKAKVLTGSRLQPLGLTAELVLLRSTFARRAIVKCIGYSTP